MKTYAFSWISLQDYWKRLDDQSFDNHRRKLKPITRQTGTSYQTQSEARFPLFGWQQVVCLLLLIWCQDMFEKCQLQIKIPPFVFDFWGTDLEPFQVSHALSVVLDLSPGSSTEGGAAIVSHQSRFFFSEHLWVAERFLPSCCVGSHTCVGRTDGAGPGPPSF